MEFTFFLPWSSTDIKEHVKQLEKAVSGKEPRFVLRALRMLPSTSRRLNHYVLYKAVHGFFTSNNATRDFLLPFLEEVSGVRPAQECGLGLRHTGTHTPPWVAVSHPGDLSCYLPQQRHEAKQPLLILICSLTGGPSFGPVGSLF